MLKKWNTYVKQIDMIFQNAGQLKPIRSHDGNKTILNWPISKTNANVKQFANGDDIVYTIAPEMVVMMNAFVNARVAGVVEAPDERVVYLPSMSITFSRVHIYDNSLSIIGAALLGKKPEEGNGKSEQTDSIPTHNPSTYSDDATRASALTTIPIPSMAV